MRAALRSIGPRHRCRRVAVRAAVLILWRRRPWRRRPVRGGVGGRCAWHRRRRRHAKGRWKSRRRRRTVRGSVEWRKRPALRRAVGIGHRRRGTARRGAARWTTVLRRRPVPLLSPLAVLRRKRAEDSAVGSDRAAKRIHTPGLRYGRRERRRPFPTMAPPMPVGRAHRKEAGWRRKGCTPCHRRDPHHRSLQLTGHCTRARRRRQSTARPTRGGRLRRRRARRTRQRAGLVHHKHGALELGRRRTLQMEVALGTSLSRIGVLRATVRTEHRRTSVGRAA